MATSARQDIPKKSEPPATKSPPHEIDHSAGDSAAKLWLILSVIWFPLFASFGFILASEFTTIG